jgi:CubicO group peptidase (beta-lactamase class C family)
MIQKLLITITLLLSTGNYIFSQKLADDLNSLFKDVASDTNLHFNGIIIVAEHGKVIYQNSIGYSDISLKIPNSDSTRFHLASLSKIFTAVAILQLVEKGKLKLNDSLVAYLPEFPYPAITINQLLSHTSGLPDFNEIFPPDNDQALTNADVVPRLRKYGHLLSVPGQSWSYSSSGYALLALLVEKISGLPFANYIEQNICIPAGMQHTYVQTPYTVRPDYLRAIPYVNPGQGSTSLRAEDSLKTDIKNPWQTLVGPGNVVSSGEDLLRFDQALNEGKILQHHTQEQMYTPVKLADGSFAQLSHAPILAGLGWGIDIDQSSGKIVSHNGGSLGMSTIFLRNLRNDQTIIVLENTDNSATIAFGVNAMNILNQRPLIHFRSQEHQ